MKNNSKNAILDALKGSTLTICDQPEKKGTQILLTDEFDLVGDIALAEDLVTSLLRSKGNLFSVKEQKHRKGQFLHSTALGSRLLQAISSVRYLDNQRHFPQHRFHPYYDLFVEHLKTKQLDVSARLSDEAGLIGWCNIINSAVNDIRNAVAGTAFKSKIQAYRRTTNKNATSLRNYLYALFKHYPRLFGIRLDLTYRQRQDRTTGDDTTPLLYDDVKAHLKTLLKFMTSKLPQKCLRGYVWKLEHSLLKSYNYHVVIFIDADIADQNTDIVQKIGEHWNTVITKDSGLYRSYDPRDAYKAAGTGIINCIDTNSQELIDKILVDMTKTDYFMQLALPGKGRAFGKGVKPKPIAAKPSEVKEQIKPASKKRVRKKPHVEACDP